MRVLIRVFAAPLAFLLLAGEPTAQAKAGPPVEKRARSLVNQLELADRRVAAVEELLAIGAAAVPALAARLNDPRPEVVQVVCEVLCALGTTAAAALPQLTTAFGSPNPAIVRMARMTELAVRATGATTLCEYEKQQVVQIDAHGVERELLKGEMAWDVDLLPGGHLLATIFQKSRVVEFDDKGKEVWSFGGLRMALEADRLLDGHTLIADSMAHRVVEVDEKGNEVWTFATPGKQPYDVERLANGRTLIAVFPGQVLEVDRAGEVVWELRDLGGVFDADRLPNGNTLLTLYTAGAVREVNKNGEVVWEVKDIKEPNDADRLPNGNTLVGTANRLIELSPDGKIVSEWQRGKRVSEVARR